MLLRSDTLLVVAILLAALAVPLAWLTSHTKHVDATDFDHQITTHTFMHIYGTNGTFYIFFTIPFWLTSVLTCSTAVFVAARQRGLITAPQSVTMAMAIASIALLALLPFFCYTASDLFRLDIGWYVALAGSICLLVALRSPSSTETSTV